MRSCGRHVQDLLLKFLSMEKGFFTSRRVIWNNWKSPQIRSLIIKSLILISLPRSYVVLLTFVC
uniref:Uncharacterized protein n=1 Tax=Cucumis melo TaxID=3656 RepID=A0A9I9E4G7_CUCME